ncbi:DUF302 domain-containing protein [Salegentibacter sp. F188]|uniref:DUF302 domain-containing protein n=1 Tax=Autumnicola patrickiae TaxID=3075591 RepID=A0ABU3DZT1_9FLAO|nr:DUF302 domain-containing protein [Salegentibacter sp. F188]MDT0689170.1 DUF302 domain-containing protein [Salegentibacter sp. F188]
MEKIAFLFGLCLLLMGCENDDPGDVLFSSDVMRVTGTRYSASNNEFDETYTGFKNAVNQNININILTEVDHAANAIATGRVLNPVSTVFFEYSQFEALLLVENPLVGLDLPIKMMFYQNENSEVFAVYNSVPYLTSRYGLEGSDHYNELATSLRDLANAATNAEVKFSANATVDFEEGITSLESAQNFSETFGALRSAISVNENLDIIAQVNHQATAAAENVEIPPSTLIIFSYPELEAQLMQESQTVALDLPQKILVWQDEEEVVHISYNDPDYLIQRHVLTGNSEELQQIVQILEDLASVASGN